ncbi:DUF2249 domain-containing protein [Alicyclobacillaceae bacterium I2511]|nr:DUF2249 domain-containing protein [Alicyclobacillaceae bacterium I2511]
MPDFSAKIVAMDYPPNMKHKVILETFDSLHPGETMLLVNDHDPVPLRYQFMMERADQFTWSYVEQGPDVFQVAIGRTQLS